MKVYVVLRLQILAPGVCPREFEGVFSTKAKADAYVKRMNCDALASLGIRLLAVEWTIDKARNQ